MLAFADTETTGFYVDAGHEAWEVAVLVVDDDTVSQHVWQLPVDVSKADPMALAMNGWYQRSFQQSDGLSVEHKRESQGMTYTEMGLPVGMSDHETFAREFMDIVHGCVLIGAVPSFDERFLTKALRRGGGVQCWHYQPVDVETLAAGWLLGQAEFGTVPEIDSSLYFEPGKLDEIEKLRTPRWDSEVLSRLVGVDPGRFDRHSAMGDVLWARAIYDVIMTPPAR